MANVVFGSDVRLGARSVVHSGAVVGADGFGFAPDEQGHLHEIAQLGGVEIGEDVSIGACSSIDRGAVARCLQSNIDDISYAIDDECASGGGMSAPRGVLRNYIWSCVR